jgi:hypothetical protein
VKIKFREDWNGYKRGEIVELTKGLMVKLIRYGHAVEAKPDPKPEPKPAPKTKPRGRKKKVEKAVTIEKE